jgi:hypothetical protein
MFLKNFLRHESSDYFSPMQMFSAGAEQARIGASKKKLKIYIKLSATTCTRLKIIRNLRRLFQGNSTKKIFFSTNTISHEANNTNGCSNFAQRLKRRFFAGKTHV